jgi:hypothetical protein
VASTRTRDWATVDFYATLGIEPDASGDDVARAYRRRAKELHPDAGAPVAVAEQFSEVTRAYEVLRDDRLRRDYDAVRSDLALRRAMAGEVTVRVPAGPPPRFRAAAPSVWSWTPRRAWVAFVGGLLVVLLGAGVAALVVSLQQSERDDRAGRVAVEAERFTDDGRPRIRFTTPNGTVVEADEPHRENPGRPSTVPVLYDPQRPTDVIADESRLARDITLWIVAAKLLVGGPVFAALGWRQVRRFRAATAATAATAVR